ncbi:hypothetical protein RGU72_20545, partial [Undibacterium sp. 5I1]|uniref:hypothetical protein n=1 Tax=Undibacterium sp. 5I1 TaxID=3048590 RepID=UPI002AB337F0
SSCNRFALTQFRRRHSYFPYMQQGFARNVRRRFPLFDSKFFPDAYFGLRARTIARDFFFRCWPGLVLTWLLSVPFYPTNYRRSAAASEGRTRTVTLASL